MVDSDPASSVGGVSLSSSKHRGPFRALLSGLRPVQWVKNGLIFLAPAAAGTLTKKVVLAHTLVAVAAYCLISSAVYLINDLRDRASDQRHPTKKHRAIASGQISPRLAVASALVLLVAGFSLPALVVKPAGLYLILALYVVISLNYSFWLKTVPVIELGAVASGFFLRAYAGAAASHIYVSSWFLVVISFGALFLVTGKRSSELLHHADQETRKVLSDYTPAFLQSALTLCATVVVTSYCLWAFDTSTTGLSSAHHHIVPIRISVVPVVFAILYIMKSAEAGNGAAPEELVVKDRTVQSLLLLWALALAIGIYA